MGAPATGRRQDRSPGHGGYARGRIDTSFPHTTIRYREVNSGVQVVRVM
jgi:hypothetical protein